MYIKDNHGNAEKIYFSVFVCGATGTGHIEVCVDASSEAFANSFERFSARRGIPSLVISDQGSNFKGYYNELTKISNDSVVKNFLSDKGISWKYTPIGDPHFNGLCERALGILKNIMKKAVKNRLLTLDQLHTVACYAESLFNERPLGVLDANDPNFVPVTPNTLVYGRSLRHFSHSNGNTDAGDPDFEISVKSCEVMQKRLRSTLASVRKTYISEYLGSLARKDEARQKRSPYTKSIIKPQINDWVLIKDDSRDLRIGKILTLIISDDGEVRSVKVKTKSHEGIYPVTNLRFLEFHNPKFTNHSEELEGSEVMPKARPKRAAAEKAINAMKNCE